MRGPFRGTKATKKSQPMVVQQGNFLQEYPQKLFHPTKKNQNAGGSFRQEFFLRDLTANLLFSSSDVSCSPGENSTRKGKDRCPSLQVSNQKKGPPLVVLGYFSGMKFTRPSYVGDYFIKALQNQDPYPKKPGISHMESKKNGILFVTTHQLLPPWNMPTNTGDPKGHQKGNFFGEEKNGFPTGFNGWVF